MSYLQDPKSVKLLAEKTRDIWKVSYIDGMEECFTALPMHLLVAEEKISAPTKRLHCNSVVGEVLRGSSEEMKTGPATGLLLVPSEVVGSFSKEVLGRLCKGSSAPATLLLPLEHARAQAVSPTDNSSEHLMSYLQDPKSVRILAEKTREIWKVSYIDGVEECFTALPMLLELQSDQHSPRSSHTADMNLASAQDIDRQQLAACSKSNCHIQETDECSRGDTERQMLDASKNRCQEVQIFIRHCSGQVVLMVNLDESSEHMMNLFEKETKMKLVHHYFKYGNSRIDPNCTLLSYGVGRNATVDAYSRLLGGSRTSLEEYFHVKRNDILMEVTLPDEKISLEMTVEGCRIMSTWLSCFMWAFSQGKSWGGSFTLKDFYVLDGHVRIGTEKGLHKGHVSGAIGRDIEQLVKHLKEILCRHKSNLVSEYPPFLKSLTAFLDKRKTVKTISESEKLFIETHISCTTSSSWGMLLYKLHKRYLGLTQAEKSEWDDAIKSAVLPHGWRSSLSEMIVFKDMFKDAEKGGRKYGTSNIGAFTLMRDTAMHGLDDLGNENTSQKRYQNADELALMIPAHMLDFLPNIIENLINKNIDISAELFAAKIRCSCQACAPSF
ncbi:unnamed protein product [Urochloa decumbens]|uniref:Ubiquitin-like domain-containing protein n=1 Tax=Urochloa decumbens TaxID=240449 RepID=A0ABC9D5R4_9POAL